jgi:hypothetical protein
MLSFIPHAPARAKKQSYDPSHGKGTVRGSSAIKSEAEKKNEEKNIEYRENSQSRQEGSTPHRAKALQQQQHSFVRHAHSAQREQREEARFRLVVPQAKLAGYNG